MCRKVIINCENLEESINALSAIYNVENDDIVNELQSINISDIYLNAQTEYEIYFYICKKLVVQPRKIDKIFWFHFSKSLDISNYYKQGLLPTNKVLPKLMDDCYILVKEKFSKEQWRKIWNTAITELNNNDKVKFENPIKDFGPNGMLVKEIGLYPARSSVGYFFERPEIIEGILRGIDDKHATNLMDTFSEQGKSCVVTFVCDFDKDIKYIVNPILLYVYNKLHGQDLVGCSTNYDAKNNEISKNSIIKVETISFNDNGEAILTLVNNN